MNQKDELRKAKRGFCNLIGIISFVGMLGCLVSGNHFGFIFCYTISTMALMGRDYYRD